MHIAMFICLLLNLPYMVQFRYIFLIVMFLCVYICSFDRTNFRLG
uniref:Uncharacterized protein n=2 Tax=Anguilla anguilla TaxID=7936 RepID=A0A0E9R6K5_ANGAN